MNPPDAGAGKRLLLLRLVSSLFRARLYFVLLEFLTSWSFSRERRTRGGSLPSWGRWWGTWAAWARRWSWCFHGSVWTSIATSSSHEEEDCTGRRSAQLLSAFVLLLFLPSTRCGWTCCLASHLQGLLVSHPRCGSPEMFKEFAFVLIAYPTFL